MMRAKNSKALIEFCTGSQFVKSLKGISLGRQNVVARVFKLINQIYENPTRIYIIGHMILVILRGSWVLSIVSAVEDF